MQTPNFLDMDLPELEKWHQDADAQVMALRLQMLTCHDVLTMKQHRSMRAAADAKGSTAPGINLAVENGIIAKALADEDLDRLVEQALAEQVARAQARKGTN